MEVVVVGRLIAWRVVAGHFIVAMDNVPPKGGDRRRIVGNYTKDMLRIVLDPMLVVDERVSDAGVRKAIR
jgi:hypothetical protein